MAKQGIQGHRKRVLPIIQGITEIPSSIKVSDNGKTGVSINLSIAKTCQPTKECSEYCYGLRGPITFKNSIVSQAENTLRFQHLEIASLSDVDAECHQIAYIVKKAKQNWLRWNGVGDLIPGSVRVINRMAELHPEITQWIVSRKVEQVKGLSDHKSIKILFSLDRSTPDTILQRVKELKQTYKKAKFRFAWTRRDANPVPRHVSIIFNEHIGKHKGDWSDKRVCEATLPDNSHDGSCDTCRRCFA